MSTAEEAKSLVKLGDKLGQVLWQIWKKKNCHSLSTKRVENRTMTNCMLGTHHAKISVMFVYGDRKTEGEGKSDID